MRITSEVTVARSLDRLQGRLEAFERSQSELGTGKRIIKPSDDPTGSRRAMSLRSSMKAQEQFLSNISDAKGWLNNADSQLASATERLDRVRQLTVDASSMTEPQERQAIATEIREIRGELQAIANTKHMGRPLFGGYAAGDAVTYDEAATPPYAATGADEAVTRRVSDSETVTVNVTAHDWLGFDEAVSTDPDTGADQNTLAFLDRLAQDISDGAMGPDVSEELAGVDAALERVASSRSDIGAATNRVESAESRATSLQLTQRTELSDVEDVDIAEGVMELQVQESAYQATLQALAKALPPSLGAFLR